MFVNQNYCLSKAAKVNCKPHNYHLSNLKTNIFSKQKNLQGIGNIGGNILNGQER